MKKRIITFITFILISLILVCTLFGATFNVNSSATFQTSLTTAADNGEADSIYLETGEYIPSSTFTFYAGEDYSLLIEGTITETDTTILDGGDSIRVMFLTAMFPNSNLILRNFLIQNGNHTSEGAGGLFIETNGANVEIENLNFRDNRSTVTGGAASIGTNSGSCTISNCVFSNNQAGDDAAGLFYSVVDGSISLSNCEFINNSIITDGDDAGGAMLYAGVDADTPEIYVNNNTFSSNQSEDDAGGLMVYMLAPEAYAEISNNTFNSNLADLNGGGCWVRLPAGGELIFDDNEFSNNSTNTAHGGGTYLEVEVADMTITNNTFTENEANEYGGAMWIENLSGEIQIYDNIFSDNSAGSNGGSINFFTESGNAIIEHNISNSNSSGNVGGFLNLSTGSGSFEIYNNTSYNDNAIDGGGIYFYSEEDSCEMSNYNNIYWQSYPQAIAYSGAGVSLDKITITYSDIEGGTGEPWFGEGCIDADPMFADSSDGDFHILTGSPCIDAGDPDSPRDPDSTVADLGRYYYDQTGVNIPPTARFSADSTSGYAPFTVDFIDQSIRGSCDITTWKWIFGTGDSSAIQNPEYTYDTPGYYTVSLQVTDENDSTDTEIEEDFITVYGNEPPASPDDVEIEIINEDAVLTWNAIDTTTAGNPIPISAYLVYFSQIADQDSLFFYHGYSTDTTYTHQNVAQFSDDMFYRITSFVGEIIDLDERKKYKVEDIFDPRLKDRVKE